MNQSPIPPLAELLASARVVALPMRTRFRGITEREVLLFRGSQGWAEWSPFVEYPDAEAAVWLSAAIEFGYGQLPKTYRSQIKVNATLPACRPDEVESILERFGNFETVKIKVAESGQTSQDDLSRVLAVKANHPAAKIRLDANGSWSVDEAVDFVRQARSQDIEIEYLEQPVKTIDEMIELKTKLVAENLSVLLAADELVRKSETPLAVSGAADVLVLKAAPLGGISRALDISAELRLPAVVSSALDSSVGISMGAHLAAALPELNFDCGLGTATLLTGDITREPMIPIDGKIEVRRVEVDESKLEIFKAQDHRIDWWLERLERCYKLL